jgi:hypothetical protein
VAGRPGAGRARDAGFPGADRAPQSLESLSRALLASETLDEHEAYAAAGVPHSAASPDLGPPLASVWSSGEQSVATGVAARNGRSHLPTTLQAEQEQL